MPIGALKIECRRTDAKSMTEVSLEFRMAISVCLVKCPDQDFNDSWMTGSLNLRDNEDTSGEKWLSYLLEQSKVRR